MRFSFLCVVEQLGSEVQTLVAPRNYFANWPVKCHITHYQVKTLQGLLEKCTQKLKEAVIEKVIYTAYIEKISSVLIKKKATKASHNHPSQMRSLKSPLATLGRLGSKR